MQPRPASQQAPPPTLSRPPTIPRTPSKIVRHVDAKPSTVLPQDRNLANMLQKPTVSKKLDYAESPRKRKLVAQDAVEHPLKKFAEIQSEKSYVRLFLDQTEINKTKYKMIDQGIQNPNELLICTKVPSDSEVSHFDLLIYFDQYNDIDVSFETDLDFYTSLFYSEVIMTFRYKEAWQIICKKYKEKDWIHKFIYFLLTAPPIVPLLLLPVSK